MNGRLSCWIEAMRLRTLPVSVAGVIMAIGFAQHNNCFNATPAWLCLIFAALAQIASNFANEYYDFRAGLDKPGREGPRRGVTEGDISPKEMLTATYTTLSIACLIGCSLLLFGSWWLFPTGILIAIGVVAYSTGPYPLSHHGLGEAAVILFFGIIPVNLTYYLQCGLFSEDVFLGSVSAGLMGANVLIVNNYRDMDDDKAVGKHTLAVICGRRTVSTIYLFNGLIAAILMHIAWNTSSTASLFIPVSYVAVHTLLWTLMTHQRGHALNPVLGLTAMAMLAFSLTFAIMD